MKPVHSAVFPKMRLCRKFPLDLRCGSKEFLRLGMEDLFITQGCEKLAFFLEERNGSSLSRDFVRSNYEWALMHIDIGNQELFQLNYEKLGCLLPRVWIKSLWEFAHTFKLQLPSGSCDLKLLRLGDEYLVQRFTVFGYKK